MNISDSIFIFRNIGMENTLIDILNLDENKSSKFDHNHHSSVPRDNRDDYDKENIDFQILSPQPQRDFYLPKMQRYRDKGKKTLVLDLDETLVHSTFDKWSDPDITLTVNFEGKENNIYVKIRPGAINFLQRIHKYYEVVIFTASVANYADPLIDILDVDKYSFFKLFREHCTYNGNYVKDLSKNRKGFERLHNCG